ncbi:gliding motility-associated ABC transporter substrate-binding protein GldG [Candidatus Velamenicoccus archaeovorus]|uniref:Gliding motility-associated ABC transporter substrate-binding protein GldG n=1 Tax=Velamenicoccus archaeovorus TaxID=1930593 RepID=A0A410P6V0_VELA1|nr:Gldg family protein [Candidatus Velamenicoccus archaeovorus]QAT17788.1 gliding motility-associated ABC transporter substrate-binding protein GldG [Candidatus Velamenicoccus archaeovorus]
MNIANIGTTFRRETGAYFNSAIAYIYLVVFVAINNGLFMTQFFLLGKADMRLFFNNLPFTLFIFIPVITMRLWAEDRKENTFELLMTFPMNPLELVIGKFLASLVFYAVALLSSFAIPVVLLMTGKPDMGVVFSGYLGALFVGGLFLSIGIFISGLTKEQIVAFVLTVLSCFMVYFLGTDLFASLIDGWIAGAGTFIMNTLGAASHLDGFHKGVIDIKDIIYFAVGCGIFIFLNSLFFEGRYRPKSRLVFGTAVVVGLAIMVVFNWLVHDLQWGRFDVTEGKIYTVSPASKRILDQLKAPVEIRVYLTPPAKMPTMMKTMEEEIAGRLKELKLVSDNKLDYKIIHIDAAKLIEQAKGPDEKVAAVANKQEEGSLERSLEEKGIVPFQVESIDRDEVGVKLVYAAMTIDYKEKGEELLPRIVPQTLPDLEYLLLSRIVKMTFDHKPKIVLFSPLRGADVTPEMNQLLFKLGKASPQYEDDYKNIAPLVSNNGYDYQRVALTEGDPLPPDATELLVINPGSLNARQLYEINKYLYQGGSVIVAAQGYDYAFQMVPPRGVQVQPFKLSLDINNLLGKWGIKINEDMLMDESSDIVNVSTEQRVGPFAVSIPVKVPNQILVRQDTMNSKLPLMRRQPAFLYMWGSALDVADEVVKSLNLSPTVLFTSSAESWKVPYTGGLLKPDALGFLKADTGGKFVLGMILQGQFTNTFADQGVPPWPSKIDVSSNASQAEAVPPQKAEEKLEPRPGKLVVVGCSKMFSDSLIGNPANLSLFANLVDSLALGEDVVQIRSKTEVSRDIKKLSDAQKLGLRFMAVVLVPILWIGFASLRLFLRRKEKQFYLMAHSR